MKNYNGDDGHPFDEEFHYKLTCGLHLMDEKAKRYFEIGFKAAKIFIKQNVSALLIENPAGNGLDRLSQNNGIVMALNAIKDSK